MTDFGIVDLVPNDYQRLLGVYGGQYHHCVSALTPLNMPTPQYNELIATTEQRPLWQQFRFSDPPIFFHYHLLPNTGMRSNTVDPIRSVSILGPQSATITDIWFQSRHSQYDKMFIRQVTTQGMMWSFGSSSGSFRWEVLTGIPRPPVPEYGKSTVYGMQSLCLAGANASPMRTIQLFIFKQLASMVKEHEIIAEITRELCATFLFSLRPRQFPDFLTKL